MIMEALVASVVLAVGLLSTFIVLDVAAKTSYLTKARQAGVTLARELSEDSRSIPYSQLSPGTIVSQLQALPSMANVGSGSTWQILRSGVTFTVTATECSIDDPSDGYGTHDSTFCSDSTVPAGTTLSDSNPYDMKRVTVTVSWTLRGVTHSVNEVAMITGSGQAVGLMASGLSVAGPASLAGSTAPTISATSTVTGLSFVVTAPSGTADIVWTINGAKVSCAFNNVSGCWTTTQGSGNQWTSSTWSLTGVADGTYTIGAAAEDGTGIIGQAVTMPVTLVRNIPTAPVMADWGYNTNLQVSGSAATVAEMDWQPNPEKNVSGYHIYNPSGALICTTTASTSYTSCGAHAWCMNPSACIDLSPPAPNGANLTYAVAATYIDANGVVQEGPRTTFTMTGTPSNTYTFAPMAMNTGSNCSGGSILQDMLGSYSAGTDTTQTGNTVTFCSDSFTSGANIEGGGTATAYFANPGSGACQVTATLSTNGSGGGAVSNSVTIPANRTTPSATTFSFTNNQVLTMNAGDRLDLQFDATGANCGSTALHYGGSTYPSQFQTPTMPIWAPNTPASLTITPQSDGTAVLSWPEPSGGAPVNFYRIYRDSGDYSGRYSVVPTTECVNGTCVYTDAKRTSGHKYWVTAVGGTTDGADLAESAQVGGQTS